MKDDSKHDKSRTPQDEEETPAVYSCSKNDGESKLSRRTFLELAAVAAATAALPFSALGKEKQKSIPIAHEKEVTALAVNSTGTLLVSGDKGGDIKLWQLPEGTLLHSWKGTHKPVSDLSFFHGEDALWSLDTEGALKRWDLPDGKEIYNAAFTGSRHNNGSELEIPCGSEWYAIISKNGDVEIRGKSTGEKSHTLNGLKDEATALAATSDGRLIMAGGKHGSVGLWTDIIQMQTAGMHMETVSALAISSDGKLALSAHADALLRTWHMPELRAGKTFTSTLGKPFSVAIRPQLDLIVAGSEKPEIGLWKLNGETSEPQLLKGHADAVRATVITPDGSLLISGSDDKTIRLWSLPDGKYLRNLLDLSINYKHVEGIGYEGKDIYGRTITFTLPCGSPIPPGAVCTCNCVPGAMSIPKNHTQNYNSLGYCTCDLICTCNTVCTCQSVGRGRTYYISYWYPN